MSKYVVERTFPQPLNVSPDLGKVVKQAYDDNGVEWLFSFLSSDKQKSYCVFESPSAEAIRETSQQLNLPVDSIVELGGELRPEMFA